MIIQPVPLPIAQQQPVDINHNNVKESIVWPVKSRTANTTIDTLNNRMPPPRNSLTSTQTSLPPNLIASRPQPPAHSEPFVSNMSIIKQTGSIVNGVNTNLSAGLAQRNHSELRKDMQRPPSIIINHNSAISITNRNP
jgi:hypothetical protein